MQFKNVVYLEQLQPMDIPAKAFDKLKEEGVIKEPSLTVSANHFLEKDYEKVKKESIKAYVDNLAKNFLEKLEGKVNKVFNSGALDIESYSLNYDGAVIPNAIYLAILQDEIDCSTLTPQTIKEKRNILNFL